MLEGQASMLNYTRDYLKNLEAQIYELEEKNSKPEAQFSSDELEDIIDSECSHKSKSLECRASQLKHN